MNPSNTLQKDNSRFAYYKVSSMDPEEKKAYNQKNFGLSFEEFEDLVEELRKGNESLFETTFLRHFEMAMNYLKSKLSADRDNAYDVTMNVMLEFRSRLIEGKVKYGNLQFIFTKMCSQRYMRMMGKKLDVDEYTYINKHEDKPIDEETFQLLDKSIEKMGDACKKIIHDIYYKKLNYKDLEQKYDKSSSSLRKQKERCITKLKMLLRQSLNY